MNHINYSEVNKGARRRYRGLMPLACVLVAIALVCHGLFLFARYDSIWSLIFSGASFLICMLISAFFFDVGVVRRIKLRIGEHAAFIVAFFLLGLLYMAVFSPGNVPDEMYHFNSTYKYSNMLLGQDCADDFISMRGDDIEFQHNVMAAKLTRHSYESVATHFRLFVGDGEYGVYEVDSSYPITSNVPQQRVPAALGISLAKLLGLGSVPLFYFGRFFNFLYAGSLIAAAVYITPIGSNIFKTVALLPMTLHLVASYSYDAASLGYAFLFTALLLRAVRSIEPMRTKEMVALGAVSFLLGPCKAIYVILLFGILLVPASRFSSPGKSRLFKLLIIILPLVGVAILRIPSLLQNTGIATTEPSIGQRGEEFGTFYTLADLITQPIMTMLLILRSFDYFGGQWIMQTVGGSLGWFQEEIAAPTYLVYAFIVLVLISSIRSRDDAGLLNRGEKAISLFLCALIVLAAIVALATSWTFNWEYYIFGVQGRYFLPILPLLCLCIRMPSLSFDRTIGNGLLLCTVGLNLFYLARIFAIALSL